MTISSLAVGPFKKCIRPLAGVVVVVLAGLAAVVAGGGVDNDGGTRNASRGFRGTAKMTPGRYYEYNQWRRP